ncbi:hypothetical protein [Pseudarthrobacter sp. NKDBFgelt]|uniref:hypothetical protein n=1 Tax=Pseudarthrobacter sp. NKDBFgelt TaxID=3384443 RepID=UPI0038D412C5
MNDTTTPVSPDAGRAKALREQVNHPGSSVRSSAGWTAISSLLGLGAVSSMGIIALTYARLASDTSAVLAGSFMGVWGFIYLANFLYFTRTDTQGFSLRWAVYMGIWGALWFAAVTLSNFIFQGEVWFAGLMAALLTLSTTACAWYEAGR